MQQEQGLDDKRRLEVMQLVSHFREVKDYTQEQVDAFCAENEMESVTTGFVEDYLFQAEMDMVMADILPEIFQIMKEKICWTPLFALQAAHDAAEEQRKDAAGEIVKLLEDRKVPYFYAESLLQSFDLPVRSVFESAGKITKQRSTRVFEKLAEAEFALQIVTGKH